MAKRNRPSVLKRQREAEKRQRQEKKANKAALKRERREQRGSVQPAIVVDSSSHQVVEALVLGRKLVNQGADGSGSASPTSKPD